MNGKVSLAGDEYKALKMNCVASPFWSPSLSLSVFALAFIVSVSRESWAGDELRHGRMYFKESMAKGLRSLRPDRAWKTISGRYHALQLTKHSRHFINARPYLLLYAHADGSACLYLLSLGQVRQFVHLASN